MIWIKSVSGNLSLTELNIKHMMFKMHVSLERNVSGFSPVKGDHNERVKSTAEQGCFR